MSMPEHRIALLVVLGAVVALGFGAASAAESLVVDCLMCHSELAAGPVKHAAVEMGCPTCHPGIDASDVPHKVTNGKKRGLASDQPGLCYGCHEEKRFTGRHVHAAILGGCTSCHQVHGSKNARLLNSPVPGLCFTCHDKGAFTRKYQHGPAAAGTCFFCHAPHASAYRWLLTGYTVRLCLTCHPQVKNESHLISSTGRGGHPVGLGKKGGLTHRRDPNHPDRRFSCVSCHDPHSADMPQMIKFTASSPLAICPQCHKGR
jgi:predicted CXXCH cytochrome family protein